MGMLLMAGIPFLLTGGLFWKLRRWEARNLGIPKTPIQERLLSAVWAAFLVLGILLSGMLLALGISRMMASEEIVKFLELKATVEVIKESEDVPGRGLAELLPKIVEANQWLVASQDCRRSFWTNVFNPPSILELEPIR